MKIVILGAGEMLTNLIAGCMDAGCNIVGVFRYDRVRYSNFDRYLVDTFNPSHEYTYIKSHKLYEINARSANSAEFKKEIIRLNADLVIVGTWGEKLKKPIINLPKIATINVHPSLLPKYRGPNPYLQVIKNQEKETGVSFHLMDENLDTGPILLQKKVKIESTDTGKELRHKLAAAAREGVKELVKTLDEEIILPVAQDEKYASYYSHISEDEVMLDFSKSAQEVCAHIKALHPWFKCYIQYHNRFFVPNPYKLEIIEMQKDISIGKQETVNRKQKETQTEISNLPIKTIVEKSPKEKSITIVCGDKKCLKMGVHIYGFFRPFTPIYIKYLVRVSDKIF